MRFFKFVTAGTAALLALVCSTQALFGQAPNVRRPRLPPDFYKNGSLTLRAFAGITERVRPSVVEIQEAGKTIALGTVIEANGLILTKASEVEKRKLSCKFVGGKEAAAELIATDEENDLALLKTGATGLKPCAWAIEKPVPGQWAITVGTEMAPEAVGVVSAAPRKIQPKRAMIGVQLDFGGSIAKIGRIIAGLGAEKAGLKAGDIILSVNEKPVRTGEDLIKKLEGFREGETVTLRIQRKEEQFEASMPLMVPKSEGRPIDRQERLNRLGGELSERAAGFKMALQHDTVLQPWQCGGPLVNLDGKVIGLNIARAGRVASYALTADLVQELAGKLKEQAEKAGKLNIN